MQNQAFLPKLKHMGLLRLPLALAMLVMASLATAQTTDNQEQSQQQTQQPRYYFSPGPSAFPMPSGALQFIDKSQSSNYQTFDPLNTAAPTAEDITNLQGCGGVGQSDYTSALFNMPEVFDKFKRDVNSELAKQILTYNYSLPQTAALFDTLNTYGNARYQQFQQACKLDSLKQDAKNQYMAQCVKDRFSERKALVEKALQNAKTAMAGSSGSTTSGTTANMLQAPNPISDPTANPDFIDAQAYAQSWELCALQYSTDSKALESRKTSNQKFIEMLRGAEDVNLALKPLLCPSDDGTAASEACWPNLFLPQVRLCNGSDLSNGCSPTKAYGVREAPLGVTAYFDLLRFTMLNGVVPKIIETLNINTSTIASSIKQRAAQLTVRSLENNAVITANSQMATDNVTKALRSDYLSCTSADLSATLNKYREVLNAILTESDLEDRDDKQIKPSVDGVPTNITFTAEDYQKIVDAQIKLPGNEEMEKARKVLGTLNAVALGCTINQSIPMLDPNIVVSLDTQCDASDRSAFYTMASYDASLAATRDVYRFLNLRLKQAYSRLLTEKGAGIQQAATGTTSATTVADSAELRQRLANVVKEVMIPSIETQIARLDELEKSRGQFSQRVRQIYAEKQGCIYNRPSAIQVNAVDRGSVSTGGGFGSSGFETGGGF